MQLGMIGLGRRSTGRATRPTARAPRISTLSPITCSTSPQRWKLDQSRRFSSH